METTEIEIPIQLKHIIKDILVISEYSSINNTIPFYADGFPGIMYYSAPKGLQIHPFEKEIPEIFIYGLTIEPIQVKVKGEFQIIIIQFYPYVLNVLFGLNPNTIVDDCYDLNEFSTKLNILDKLNKYDLHEVNSKMIQLFMFLENLGKDKYHKIDPYIRQSIKLILDSKGIDSIQKISERLNISKRTLERKFNSVIGIPPKQFMKIIQFQNSLNQMSTKQFILPTDVVYDNGYTDQSHFIKIFKSYTGMTPGNFLEKKK